MCDCLMSLGGGADTNTTYGIVPSGTNEDGSIVYDLVDSDGNVVSQFPACPNCLTVKIEDPDNPGEYIDLPTDGDGNPVVPSPIPSVELISITIDGPPVTNSDGSVTINYVATEEDDGDGDPATHPFSVTIPPDKFGTLTDNGDNTAEYVGVDANGDPVTIQVCTQCASVVDADGNSLEDPNNPGTFVVPTDTNTTYTLGAPVDNGDGTQTQTLNDSDGNPVGTVTTCISCGGTDVGQAVVTETSDYVANVAGTDTEGNVTSADVLTRLDRYCDGAEVDPATDQFMTRDGLLAAGRGHYVEYVDSGDGCTPADPTCPELVAITMHPDSGVVFSWPAGGPWAELGTSPNAYGERFSISVPQADFDSFGAAVPNDPAGNFSPYTVINGPSADAVEILDYQSPVVEWCNPDPCKTFMVKMDHNINRLLYQISEQGVRYNVIVRWLQDVGPSGTVPTTTIGTTVFQTDMPPDLDWPNPTAQGHSHSMNGRPAPVAPGECLAARFQVELLVTFQNGYNTAAEIRHRFNQQWWAHVIANCI